MSLSIAQVKQRIEERGGNYRDYLTSPLLRHFKAGVNAAWSPRWVDASGNHSFERAEDYYESVHGVAAADAFRDGWCFGATL